MQITGFTGTAVKKEQIVLERGGEEDENIEITITALPPSYMDLLAGHLPEPVPPKEKIPARDEKGKWLRGLAGERVYPPNLNDLKYRKALGEHQTLTTIALAHFAIKDDPNVSFDSEGEGKPLYTSIRQEMEDYGLNMGDIALIVKRVIALTGLTEEDIEAARADFLDQPETESTSSDSV